MTVHRQMAFLEPRLRFVSGTGVIGALLCACISSPAAAQCPVVSGSTGASGAFAPTSNTTVQLPPDGILNYTTVNIPAGVTVKFERNAANTPVYLLATGNVTIASNATIDVSGTSASGLIPGSGGPGGFDGGQGDLNCAGAGLGPGGGGPGCLGSQFGIGGGGGYGTAGGAGNAGGGAEGAAGATYGNSRLVPLVGGSGGGGSNGVTTFGASGGGGGGAILIATSGTLNLSGAVVANGGIGSTSSWPSYGTYGAGDGAGGAVRLVGNVLAGSGGISTSPGSIADGSNGIGQGLGRGYGLGGAGRVRIEFCQNNFLGGVPPYTVVGSLAPLFVADLPSLAITSIEGATLPNNPAGSFSLPPDLTFGAGTSSVTISLTATGIPLGTTVTVVVTPQTGLPTSVTSTPLSGTLQSSSATADITLATGKSLVTAEATVTISSGGGGALAAAEIGGERIAKMHVSAAYAGASQVTYITASGREVAADSLAGTRGTTF